MQEVRASDAREEKERKRVQAERGKRSGISSSGGIKIWEVWACGTAHRWLVSSQTRAEVSTAPMSSLGSSWAQP